MQTTSNLSFGRHILIFKLIDLNILNKILARTFKCTFKGSIYLISFIRCDGGIK
jgi:hypothetical protein